MKEINGLIVQSIVQSMPIGLMVIDPDGKISVVNEALEGIVGYSKEEMQSKGWGKIFIERENNFDFNDVLIDVIRNEMVNLCREVAYENPSGESLRLSITSSYLKMDNNMVGIVLLFEDVTEKYVLHKREKEILSAMHYLQKERSESLNKLALSVAHQIRNPMVTIGGFANMLLKHSALGEQEAGTLDVIIGELGKLENVVRAVVEYASLPAVQKDVVFLPLFIAKACEAVEAKARSLGRSVDFQVECKECRLKVDALMFTKALEAVLLNSVEASLGQGDDTPIHIIIEGKSSLEGVELVVTDQGKGIPEDNLPYIYDPFFTTGAHSVGMGLCLAKRIVLEHQGEINVQRLPGKGTTVTMLIPRTE